MDLYGQDEAVNQLNSRNQFVDNYNQAVADFNNNIMNQYNQAKDSEDQTDDLTYARDILNNVMSGAGLKTAYDNRAYELNKAKNIMAKRARQIANGEGLTEETRVVAGQKFRSTIREPTGVKGFLGISKPQKVFLPDTEENFPTDKAPFPAENPAPDLAPAPANNPPPPKPAPEEAPVLKQGEPGTTNPALLTKAEREADGVGHGIIAHSLNKLTGVGLDTGETIGKIGGAATSAGMGGVALYGDIKNMLDNKGDPFKKDASWEDDVNNVGSVIQGVSDVVGIIPGLEWVAGLGNLVGAGTSVIGMFGDHDKNIQHDKNVENMKNQLKDTMARQSGAGELVQSAPSQAQAQLQKAGGTGAF